MYKKKKKQKEPKALDRKQQNGQTEALTVQFIKSESFLSVITLHFISLLQIENTKLKFLLELVLLSLRSYIKYSLR